jgi:uncharacterized protein (TIGR02466 family)
MTPINLFPTTIGVSEDLDFTNKLLPIVKDYLSRLNESQYRWGYKITYDANLPLNTDPVLEFVRKKILEQCAKYSDLTMHVCPTLGINIWFSEMTNGDKHYRHNHTNSVFSGIFYLSVPENSSPITFFDPRDYHKHVYLTQTLDTSHYTIQPKDGLCMIWPSWLEHQVPKNENLKEPRITAVFDTHFN